MQRVIACPEDVRSKIAGLRVPIEEVSSGGRMTTNWRSSGGGGGRGGGGGGHWHGRAWPGGGGGHTAASGGGGGRGSGGGGGGGPRPYPQRSYANRSAIPRFGNKARKDATTEDRMMDRIRDKMNKFSSVTYDATKTWLSQLLDSGQTDFLTDFITLVFDKASTERPFCTLYARLITELRASFPHLEVELRRIFDEFLGIFADADGPDVASAEYAEFVALRDRRKARRGYAAFVSEVANQKVLRVDDVMRTCGVILDGLMAAKVSENQTVLCEEYADCLTTIMKGCEHIIRPSVAPFMSRIKEAMKKEGSPSLSNKARFALMDLTDLF
jgi:hypothetical protein